MTDMAAAAARFAAITGCDTFPPTHATWSWSSWESRLAALAPAERRRLGVYTTPEPLVRAVVADVDAMLREGFGLTDGLGDTTTWGELVDRGHVARPPAFSWSKIRDEVFVRVLDPACGTGIFPGAALTLAGPALADRLHCVEIDPVAWGLCHLALAPGKAHLRLASGLEEWAPALPITVVIGNPPWSGLSENRGWIVDLLRGRVDGESYYEVDGAPLGERKLWLQDDYVKFMRLAQYHVDRAGAGVMGFVTNHGWLDNPTFRGMRASLCGRFPTQRVLDLGGNANRTQGAPDENVFGIRQGVCAAVLSTHGDGAVRVGTLRGGAGDKLARVAAGVAALCDTRLLPTAPAYLLRPAPTAHPEYARYTPLTDLFPLHTTGLVTARDKVVVGTTPEEVLARVQRLRDSVDSDDAIRALYFGGRRASKYPPGDTRSWRLPEARARLGEDPDWALRVRPYYYRPLDVRYVYAAPWMVDWGRPDVARHLDPWFGPPLSEAPPAEQVALVWMRQVSTGGRFSHVLVARQPVDNRCMRSSRGISSFAPLFVDGRPNLRPPATLADVAPRDVLGFVYATLWDLTYIDRHHASLCREVPRVPLERFDPVIAARGRWLVSLHLGDVEPMGAGDAHPVGESVAVFDGAQLGGVDASARFRRARSAGGRRLTPHERERATWVAQVAQLTRRWQHGAFPI